MVPGPQDPLVLIVYIYIYIYIFLSIYIFGTEAVPHGPLPSDPPSFTLFL